MTRNAKKTAAASKTDSSSDEESITSKSSRGVEVIPESGKKDTDKEAPKTDDAGPSPAPTRSDKPDLPSGDKIKEKVAPTPMKPSSGGKINLSTASVPFFHF